jgi:glycosyltransferase involved in cell wall biosynthesis
VITGLFAECARARPSLSVSIITRDSESRLAQVIAHARAFADEVAVGVDADSEDGTWEQACRFADTTYRFRHPNQLAPAHLLALRYCKGDWILRLDDDEFMEEGFGSILPELLQTPRFSHYYLPRKWVVSLTPPLYMHDKSWYPDYQLRLFRNDPAAIWKPPRYHTGYRIVGHGGYETRVSILHYEPICCSAEQRARKIRTYRERGGGGTAEEFFGEKLGERRAFTPPVVPKPSEVKSPTIHADVQILALADYPPWSCRFVGVNLPRTLRVSERVPLRLDLVNTGGMRWSPHLGHWPLLSVSYSLKTAKGLLIRRSGERYPIVDYVDPGQSTSILTSFTTPEAPGHFILSWDMISRFECSFESCGGQTFDTPIVVTGRGGLNWAHFRFWMMKTCPRLAGALRRLYHRARRRPAWP